MTGWSVPDDLIDYVARILRVRALLNQSITSGDLDGRLLSQILARQRMLCAEEFSRCPLEDDHAALIA
jgi:hypothetical protein